MQHRRWSNVGSDPELICDSLLPMFLTDAEVLEAQAHVEECRGKAYASIQTPVRTSTAVPEGALDDCKESYHAAQERADSDDNGKYASKGLMALVCRHDIPLFLCDIKSPGERQYFAIALVRKLASMLPTIATMGLLYDIGCQLDRSIALVSVELSSTLLDLLIAIPSTTSSQR